MAISIGSAVGAGFNLIGRRPLSVIAWGFFLYLSIAVLLAIGALILGGGVLGRVLQSSATADPSLAGQAALGWLASFWPALLVVIAGALVSGAMVQGAVYRSILTPDAKTFFSLRFGAQERALVLLDVTVLLALILAYLVAAAIVAGGVYGLTRIHGWVGVLLAVIFVICSVLAFMWVALRFALAAPMTFAEGRVRFFGSWALTRGHGWSLFGLAWLMLLVLLGVGIGYAIVSNIVSALFAVGVFASIAANAAAAHDPHFFSDHGAALLAALTPSFIFGAVFQGLVQAIAHGPWIEAYRQLTGAPDVAQTFS